MSYKLCHEGKTHSELVDPEKMRYLMQRFTQPLNVQQFNPSRRITPIRLHDEQYLNCYSGMNISTYLFLLTTL